MNRRERRAAERELRKAIKSGVGVKAGVVGYRVVKADGTVKLAVGRQPTVEGVRS